ncbi:MAG: ribose 5-phosphate isomerase B [Clostridiales bacterium]|nr:ribose 5-phosphate isomerase B [Clostridiales bacterium]
MIAIGSDQAAYEMKSQLKEHLESKGYKVNDIGSFSEESVDYPIYGEKAATEVANGNAQFGIIICGTGIGISMAASKVPGIRCAVCTNSYMAKMAREHNNANMLALGARVIGMGVAKEIINTFLNTVFLGGRHATRVDIINKIDKKYRK